MSDGSLRAEGSPDWGRIYGEMAAALAEGLRAAGLPLAEAISEAVGRVVEDRTGKIRDGDAEA